MKTPLKTSTSRLIPLLAVLAGLMALGFGIRPLGAQPAADVPPPQVLLNSERIEQTFGSYGIDVLASDERLRISKLYSTEPEGPVCRTFAVTRYPAEIDAAFAAEHAAILDGGSIGAVFAARGWRVDRRHLWLGEVPPSARVLELMGSLEPSPLAIHLFELIVSRDGASFRYATIAEVHHPAYLILDDLYEIFGADWRLPAAAEPAAEMLKLTLEAMH